MASGSSYNAAIALRIGGRYSGGRSSGPAFRGGLNSSGMASAVDGFAGPNFRRIGNSIRASLNLLLAAQ